VQDIRDKQRISRKRDEQISLDGKWRSFPRVPHLQQYVTSGAYFGKVKINGRRIKKSLETAVWSTAQLRLAKFLKEEHENRGKADPPLFKEAWERFDQELENDATIKPRSKEYRRLCMQKIETTWPELFKLRLDEITPAACKDWIGKLNGKLASTYFNNTVATLRLVIDCGLAMHKGNERFTTSFAAERSIEASASGPGVSWSRYSCWWAIILLMLCSTAWEIRSNLSWYPWSEIFPIKAFSVESVA
jgi:hypothetical protein